MEKKPQTLQNHGKVDPLFHFFLIPVALFLLVDVIIEAVKSPTWMSLGHVLVVFWAMIAMFKIRLYALKVQDRVIRLEERLRLERLLAEPLKSRIYELTEQQLIAIRFASDGEIPALIDQVLKSTLTPKQIKAAIQSWRPDYWRV